MSTVKSKFFLTRPELKLWLYVFAGLCIIFSPLICQFIWGNHDWQPLISDNGLDSGLIEGRFSQYTLVRIFLMGKILPILNILIGLLLYAAALVLLYSRFFEFSVHKSAVIPLLVAATLPYINEILYFQFIVFSQLSWPLVLVFALICAKKASSTPHFFLYTGLSFILLLLSLGGYPATINFYMTATCLWIIRKQTKNVSMHNLLKIISPFAISLLAAFLSLYLIYNWLSAHHLMMNLYNNQTPAIKDLILKIIPTIGLSLQSLIQPQPFFSLSFKLITSTIIILFIAQLLHTTHSKKQFIILVVMLPILFLCIKFSAWLTTETSANYFAKYDPAAFMIRTDFYAVPCLILFCLTILREKKNILRNLSLILSGLLFINSTVANFNFAKVHLFGFHAEELLQQRLNARIQEHLNYNPKTMYTIIQAGELPLRHRYYQSQKHEKYGYYTLQIPYFRHWIAFEYYNFWEPTPFVKEGTAIDPTEINKEMIDFLSQKITLWPQPNSVYIDNNYGIIALTSKGKSMLTDQFNSIKDTLP